MPAFLCKEGISINQLVSTAVAEKLSALMTEEYLKNHAKRGSRKRFVKVMSKAPDKPTSPEDPI